jgi:hypothetical protein
MIAHYLPAFLTGWVATTALLALMHLLWKDALREVRYLLGGGALCAGCSLVALILDDPLLLVGPWIVGFPGGLLIVGWTWYERRYQADKHTAQRRGEIVGAAKGLTQELIDAGGRRGSDRPGAQN